MYFASVFLLGHMLVRTCPTVWKCDFPSGRAHSVCVDVRLWILMCPLDSFERIKMWFAPCRTWQHFVSTFVLCEDIERHAVHTVKYWQATQENVTSYRKLWLFCCGTEWWGQFYLTQFILFPTTIEVPECSDSSSSSYLIYDHSKPWQNIP